MDQVTLSVVAFWYSVIAAVICMACVLYARGVEKFVMRLGPKPLRVFLDATGPRPIQLFGLLAGVSGVIVYIILYSRIR